ncbi:hypothetical protein M9H77_18761 [Catharanthus roseus]|uniref:Uncharacterized protein n=1 Tax=Catharanthus roseus TaxID=4058 RepID=A0ACC0B8J9_CATRO|nr:hypothetical protein M9H77_18761 [Catharanthus roseus]
MIIKDIHENGELSNITWDDVMCNIHCIEGYWNKILKDNRAKGLNARSSNKALSTDEEEEMLNNKELLDSCKPFHDMDFVDEKIEGAPCVKDIFNEEDAMTKGEDDRTEGVAQRTVDSGGSTVDKDMQSVEEDVDDATKWMKMQKAKTTNRIRSCLLKKKSSMRIKKKKKY